MFGTKKQNEFKRWHLVVIAVVIVVAVIYKIYSLHWPTAVIEIAGQKVTVLVADRYNHQLEGWGNKNSMGSYGGMLFPFATKTQHTMVMRGMRFPLDIVWVDGNTVVDMAPNVPTEPGKTEAALTRYSARLPSTAVLELPAGFIAKYGLKVGDKVDY